ncbi:hypothetical protein CDD81_2355 [Ophiocordyceps australis]|uniref:Hydantoinase/oxoprolinase N-terminal domain-containing protein n=1 Tax=Ophiocordyceps australis TaxID=1399860 RepID=A0A2C5XX09_9HYPO|nr:hypothetical protein CDD81_2355 [Ophiocordyceps australis]
MSLYRIGVDVGGTNTDAALLDIAASDRPDRGVLATHKATTTADLTSGIQSAVAAVVQAAGVDASRILSVTIGTTHFINALLEADARRLDRVAVVRLCGPFTRQLPPFSGFPPRLQTLLDGGVYYLDGGLEMDGRQIAALDAAQVRRTARAIVAAGVEAVALVGVFSPLDHAGLHEQRCKHLMQLDAPQLRLVCSRDIGPVGLLERENATILNAAILRTGRRVKASLQAAMARLDLRCQLFLSQNDGSLVDADIAADFPIKTFASGPTNSTTGAAFLAGFPRPAPEGPEPQVLVVDIGGTTTDVCALLPSAFPRQAPTYVELAGVRTAFSMPHVVSIGLGGGSLVDLDPAHATAAVGPASVGHLLSQQARVFGGPTLTATDIVVAAGHASLGDARLVADLPPSSVAAAQEAIHKKLEGLIDKMRVSQAPVHVLLVGGGALLASQPLARVDRCIRPVHAEAANAVGAAIAKVSGQVDLLQVLDDKTTEAVVVAQACQRAIDLAVEKGAARDDVAIVEVNKTPLQYMAQLTLRIQVRAVGRLAVPFARSEAPAQAPPSRQEGAEQEGREHEHEHEGAQKEQEEGREHEQEQEGAQKEQEEAREQEAREHEAREHEHHSLNLDLALYRPNVRDGIWHLSELDLALMATGCGVLGTGGGGPTYYEYLKCLHLMRRGCSMRIVSPKALADDAVVCMGAWYGSPSVINERISAGGEIIDAIKAVNRIKGLSKFDALFSDEIGGGNGLSALPTSVHFDVPVVDGDAMGRAFPTMYHIIFSVYGYPLEPCSITDGAGNVSVVMNTDSPLRLERLMRASAIELGLACASSSNPLTGAIVKAYGVPNTLSQAWYLGRAVHLARRNKTSYVDAIFDVCAGKLLYTGKIVQVERYIGGGYTLGTVVIAPLSADELEAPGNQAGSKAKLEPIQGRHMVIPFQNEYLYAAYSDATGSEPSRQVVCTVPHLISILGHDGEAIGSQELRYGLRVNVIALPAHPLWRSERGLKVGGPAGFGLDMDEVGVDNDFVEAPSVIDEFGRL